jgi:hypothetical protein
VNVFTAELLLQSDDDDDDLLSPDLNRDLSQKEGLRGHPRPGVDSNVSAWSRLSVVAVHTAISPGFCAPYAEVPGLTITGQEF